MCTSILHAQKQPDQIRITAWDNFKAEEGNQWTIRWNEKTGLPRSIIGSNTKAFPGDPLSAARAFLSENRQLFGLKSNLSGLRHTKTQTHRGVHHIEFQQYYKGVKVEGADYNVHLRENGSVNMANGFYYLDIDIPTTPGIPEASAITAAISDMALTRIVKDQSTAELLVYPTDEGYELVYNVNVLIEEPYTNWQYIINAQTGEVVEKYSNVSNIYSLDDNSSQDHEAYKVTTKKHNPLTMVTGTGDVFPRTPDNSTVTTKDLLGLNTSGYLNGEYVNVYTYDASRAYSTSYTFQFDPINDNHFEEVNVYYHVDRFRRDFIESLDLNNNLFTQVVNAYVFSDQICQLYQFGACARVGAKSLDFGSGYEYTDPHRPGFRYAKDNTVIYHEYSHLVLGSIRNGLEFQANQEGAILEGIPDYFSGSFDNSAQIAKFSWDSTSFSNLIRDMSAPDIETYSEYENIFVNEGEVGAYEGAEFFSSILWDLRNDPGISVGDADQLIFDALFFLSGNPDFVGFRNALWSADGADNVATYRYVIQDVFSAKGPNEFGPPSAVPVTISGPVLMDEGDSETWTANIGFNSNGVPPYTYEWTRVIPWQTTTVVGTGTSYTGTQFDDFTLELEVTDSNGKQGFEDLAVVVDEGGGGCIICKEVALPSDFAISNNYPNPFNPSTQIKFELPETADVSINVYNIVGQRVATLVNDQFQAGFHQATFKADNLASGVYIARLTATGSSGEQFVRELKMQLIK